MKPILGRSYTRAEIANMVGGGDRESYLPHKDGRVLAGCFDPAKNKRAPIEIDVGEGPKVTMYGKVLVAGGYDIPVFLKRETGSWEYAGRFQATAFSEDPIDLDRPDRRESAVAVLFLKEVYGDDTVFAILEGREENRWTTQHYRRERSPELAKVKRRIFKAKHGRLFCEACRFEAQSNLGEAGDACFEVHHLIPLSEAEDAIVTRLDELAVICANCHRIIHRMDPLPSVDAFTSQIVAGD